MQLRLLALSLVALAALGLAGLLPEQVTLPRPLAWSLLGVAALVATNESLGRPIPLLRWSFLRMMLGMKHLTREWQVGDGREEALLRHVLATAKQGDPADVIATIDRFARERSYLINVGDEKGALLDAAARKIEARRVLELGTYCGYGAVRLGRLVGPEGRVVSVEWSPDNARIARAVVAHAGLADRVTVVTGSLGDGRTVAALEAEHGLCPAALDLVFVDHAKEVYVTDVETILGRGWLRRGGVIVADNVGIPGAPEYRAHMAANEGRRFRTIEYETHLEYQSLLKDLVLESTYLGED